MQGGIHEFKVTYQRHCGVIRWSRRTAGHHCHGEYPGERQHAENDSQTTGFYVNQEFDDPRIYMGGLAAKTTQGGRIVPFLYQVLSTAMIGLQVA